MRWHSGGCRVLKRLARRPALAALGVALILLAAAETGAAQSVGSVGRERQASITVKGVANPFSSFGIVKRLRQVPGVKNVTFDLYTGQAIVTLDPAADISEAQLREAVHDASYTAGKIQWRDASVKRPGTTEH